MTSVGPLLALLGALILFGIGLTRPFVKGPRAIRWKQAGMCFGGGVLLLLLLGAYLWSEDRHMHHDAEGDYDDRYDKTGIGNGR